MSRETKEESGIAKGARIFEAAGRAGGRLGVRSRQCWALVQTRLLER